MSVAPPPKVQSKTSKKGSGSGKVGAEQLIDARIDEACRALWWAEFTRKLLRLVICTIGALVVWIVVDQWVYSPGTGVRLITFSLLAAIGATYLWRRVIPLLGSAIQPEYAARSLERDLPDLRQSLTSYVTLRSDGDAAGLRSRVVRSIGAVTAGRLRSYDELPEEATGTLRWWVATALALALLVGYAAFSPKNSLQSAARLAAPLASIDPPHRVSIRDVQPGDVEAIAGRVVEVSADIEGMHDDEEAIVSWDLASGRQETLLIEDPDDDARFAGELSLPHSATGEVFYRIEAGDAVAGPFRLQVQDVPVVALQSVYYQPPAYTGQAPHTSSSGAITALDGTQVKILASTNRAIARAKIEFNPRALGDKVQATAGATELAVDSSGTSMSVSFPLRSARGRSAAVELENYRIKVWDAAGQSNPDPIIYPIRVIEDLPPEVSIMVPVKSPQEVPIDIQQIIEVHASDPDFGLSRLELEIRSGIDLIAQPTLWSDTKGARGRQVVEYRFRPTEHDLHIGDTVEVIAVASDNRQRENDPSIEPNVTRTDPIELRITASGPMPAEDDPDAQGLSKPDDRPASDHQEQNDQQEGQEGQGQEQSGGGGSESGEGQSGEGQSGEGQSGEGQSGEGQSGEGQSGEGQSGEGQSGEGQSGEGQSGEGQSGDDKSGDGQSGEGSQGGDGQNAEQEPGDGSNQAEGTSQTGEGKQPEGAASNSNQSEQPQQGESGTEADGQQGGDPSGNAAGQSGSGSSSGATNGAGDQQAGSSDGGGASSGQSTPGDAGQQGSDKASGGESPSHDGETFERIRDYLDQKRKEQEQGGGKGDQGAGEDGAQDSANQKQPSGDGQSGQSSQSDSGSGEQSGSKQDSKGGTEGSSGESGTQGNETDGAQSRDGQTGQEQAGDPKDSQQEGQGAAGQEEDREQGAQAGDKSGDQGQNADGQSGQQSSDQGTEGEKSDAEGSGDQSTGGQDSGGQDQSASSDQQGNEQQSDQSGKPGESQSSQQQRDSGSDQQADPNSQDSGGSQSESKSPSGDPNQSQTPPSSSNPGTGAGSDSLGEGGDSPVPPDPANVEYAKKATDMVLDYLEETRDKPDQDLLDRLNWTEDDLKRFADRWQKVRELPSDQPTQGNRDVEEALQSLGLRPPSQAGNNVRESGDTLRSIRDSGNRKPPPAAYRDAFDAFRRAMGR